MRAGANQGRLLGRGREGQALKVGEELETDGKSNALAGTESEPQSLEGGECQGDGAGRGPVGITVTREREYNLGLSTQT